MSKKKNQGMPSKQDLFEVLRSLSPDRYGDSYKHGKLSAISAKRKELEGEHSDLEARLLSSPTLKKLQDEIDVLEKEEEAIRKGLRTRIDKLRNKLRVGGVTEKLVNDIKALVDEQE